MQKLNKRKNRLQRCILKGFEGVYISNQKNRKSEIKKIIFQLKKINLLDLLNAVSKAKTRARQGKNGKKIFGPLSLKNESRKNGRTEKTEEQKKQIHFSFEKNQK